MHQILISTKLGDFNNVFRRIIVVSVAEHPHLSIPEIEAEKSPTQYHWLINCSVMVISVGNVITLAGLAAYHVYAARKISCSSPIEAEIEGVQRTQSDTLPYRDIFSLWSHYQMQS